MYSQDIGWQELTFEWTAPAGATSLTVALRAYDNSANWDGEATVYVDDYVLWGPEIHGNSAPLITNVLRFPYPMVYNGDITRVSAQISDPDGSVASDSLYKRVLPAHSRPSFMIRLRAAAFTGLRLAPTMPAIQLSTTWRPQTTLVSARSRQPAATPSGFDWRCDNLQPAAYYQPGLYCPIAIPQIRPEFIPLPALSPALEATYAK